MGRRATKPKPSPTSVAKPCREFEGADPAAHQLLMTACIATWGEHSGSRWGEKFVSAEPWTAESLRTITMDNATQRVGLDNMRRLQVTEIAYRVAEELDSGAEIAQQQERRAPVVDEARAEGVAARSREIIAPAEVERLHGEGTQSHSTGQNSTQAHSMVGIARTVTERLDGDNVAHAQAKATQHDGAGGNASEQVDTAVPDRRSSACVASSVVQEFLELMQVHGRNPRQLQRVVEGCEEQWEKSVASALRDLKEEFQIENLHGKYETLCPMSKELFMRELRGKATRILAHKKRHRKQKESAVKQKHNAIK